MPVSPPTPDPFRTEARLLMVAQMLEQAVAEVRHAMTEIRNDRDVTGQPATPGIHSRPQQHQELLDDR